MKSNILEIKDLKGKKFFIPAYQRAYRWGEDEIEKLITDIGDKETQKSYFLQPIIYRKEDEKDVIIDGQQRLTSIYIILKVLNVNEVNYTFEYETRENTTKYLKEFDKEKENSSIDNFHINIVKDKTEKLIKYKSEKELKNLKKNILKTKFIYHEVGKEEENKIFQRINTGKIALTNGELVKGLLLNRQQEGVDRDKWAIEWDQMEMKLQNDDFWYMINNDTEKYQDTRIDAILEVVAKQIYKEQNKKIEINKTNVFWIFEIIEYYSKIQGIQKLWDKITDCYKKIKIWYNNDEIYHLIGYILTLENKDYDMLTLIEEYNNSKNKKEFIKTLYEKINELNKKIKIKIQNKDIEICNEETLEIVCKNIQYENNPTSRNNITKILLLFNILTFLKQDNGKDKENETNIATNRFSFGAYKKGNWDIEHIHAKNENTDRKDGNLDLLQDIVNENDKKQLEQIKEKYKNKSQKDKKEKDADIFNEFYIYLLNNKDNDKDIEEMSDDNTINSLRNLTLLDSKTNREYQDNVFIIKRHILLEKDRNRLFIPICTRNAFLKYYSKNIRQIACWSEEDGESYLKELIKTIKFSPIYNKENKNGK